MEAACWEVPSAMDWLEEDTWPEADATWSAPSLMPWVIRVRVRVIPRAIRNPRIMASATPEMPAINVKALRNPARDSADFTSLSASAWLVSTILSSSSRAVLMVAVTGPSNWALACSEREPPSSIIRVMFSKCWNTTCMAGIISAVLSVCTASVLPWPWASLIFFTAS